jgi:hypothetical protein
VSDISPIIPKSASKSGVADWPGRGYIWWADSLIEPTSAPVLVRWQSRYISQRADIDGCTHSCKTTTQRNAVRALNHWVSRHRGGGLIRGTSGRRGAHGNGCFGYSLRCGYVAVFGDIRAEVSAMAAHTVSVHRELRLNWCRAYAGTIIHKQVPDRLDGE